MKFEQDKVRMLTGVRFGETIGSPVAIEIANTEWPKWTEVMSADPLDHELAREGRNAPLSRPRPGHADLTGMRKYGFDDARPVLERSSARETASRVALGEVAKQFLEQRSVFVPFRMCFPLVAQVLPIRSRPRFPSRRILRRWTLLRCALLTRMRKSG